MSQFFVSRSMFMLQYSSKMYVTEIEKTNTHKKIVSSETINKHKQPHRPLTITQHAERRILQYGFYYQERFLRNFCLFC